MRFLVPKNTAFDDVRDQPRAAFDSAVDRLRRAGAEVVFGTALAIDHAMPLAAVLYASEAYGLWEDVIEAAPHKMFDQILERFRAGAQVRACDYVAAWRALDDMRREYAAQTDGFDAVLVPTSPILPPDAKRLMSDHDYYVTENLLALRNTRIGNLLGLCVLTLPTGIPSCGISLMAAPGAEERLLRIGAAAESALR